MFSRIGRMKRALLLALVIGLAGLGISPAIIAQMAFGLSAAGRTGPKPPAGADVAIDETNASDTIKLTGRAWIDNSQDVWNGQTYTRYNRSRVIDIVGWTAPEISFKAISLPGTVAAGPADPYVIVVVDGAHYQDVSIPVSFIPVQYTVVLPSGTHHIELIDGWQARQNNYNAAVDGQISACYVTSVRVPTGQPSPVRRTAARGVVTFGDSTNDADANEPFSWNGWCAQLRRTLEANGGRFAYIGWGGGTLTGDGFTHQQFADMVHDLWAAMGATTKEFVYVPRPNDMAYYSLRPNHPTTAEYATFMGNVLDDLTVSDPGYIAYISSPGFPQGTNEQNWAGGTRTQYFTALAGVATGRSQVRIIDLSSAFNPATDLAEGATTGVHPNQTGQNGIYAVMKTALGLPRQLVGRAPWSRAQAMGHYRARRGHAAVVRYRRAA